MKQETLAEQLGISQQAVSKIEQSENVEDHALERMAITIIVHSTHWINTLRLLKKTRSCMKRC